jgi:hypothetical protein
MLDCFVQRLAVYGVRYTAFGLALRACLVMLFKQTLI